MKSAMPWLFLIAATNVELAFANDGLYEYREGNYIKAAQSLRDATEKDPVVHYYMGRMRLYGYGDLKNNTQALHHFKQAAERGYLPAIRFMGRYSLSIDKNYDQALFWYKKAADLNDVDAQMYCAAAYLFGVGVKPNADLAKRYYIAAAKNGNDIAQVTVAQSFLETHQSANKQLGLIWLNKALAQNNAQAQVMMGEIYAQGSLVKKDIVKARELINLAIAQGYTPAIYQMGELERSQNDFTLAKEWYTKAANLNYNPAYIALSWLYSQEKSPFYDRHEGFLLLLKAAQNGSTDAQLALASIYKNKQNVEFDENLAKEWQQKASSAMISPYMAQINAVKWLTRDKASSFANTRYQIHGILSAWNNPVALKDNDYNPAPQMDVLTRDKLYQPQFMLIAPNKIAINEYYDALVSSLKSTSKDPLSYPHYPLISFDSSKQDEQLKKLQREAFLGNSNAQFDLGQLLQQGVGVKQNVQDAIKYYQLAATQQDLRAQYNLGILYLEGHDIPADIQKGVDLLQDSAFKGNTHAQFVLARIYEDGFTDKDGKLVIQPEQDQAMGMYGLAAANDFGLAQYYLAEIMVRHQSTNMGQVAKQERMKTIKDLYQGAVGHGIKQAELPLAFFNAMDSDKNKQKQAFLVAKQAAETGSIDASILLGLMNDYGISVEASDKEAVTWYQKASSNPIGSFLLGTHLSLGTGIAKDLDQGQAMLQKLPMLVFHMPTLIWR